jgi:hypothetical protein
MKMKKYSKLILNVCLAIGLVIAFVSCSSGPTVYDKSVPPEQSSTLVISQCAITKFNGASVSPISWNGMTGVKQIQIPAGEHKMEVYQRGGGVGYETHNTVEGTFNFLPNYIYVVYLATVDMGGKFRLVGAPRSTGGISQDELIPDPTSPDASPIEGTWQYNKKGNEFIFSGNEFIYKMNGKNFLRGTFSIDGDKLTLPLFYQYKGKKWVEKFGGIYTMDFSDQGIKWMGKTLKKL